MRKVSTHAPTNHTTPSTARSPARSATGSRVPSASSAHASTKEKTATTRPNTTSGGSTSSITRTHAQSETNAHTANAKSSSCDGVAAYTLEIAPAPLPWALPGCRDAFDMAGAPAGRVCPGDGLALGPSPKYLVPPAV